MDGNGMKNDIEYEGIMFCDLPAPDCFSAASASVFHESESDKDIRPDMDLLNEAMAAGLVPPPLSDVGNVEYGVLVENRSPQVLYERECTVPDHLTASHNQPDAQKSLLKQLHELRSESASNFDWGVLVANKQSCFSNVDSCCTVNSQLHSAQARSLRLPCKRQFVGDEGIFGSEKKKKEHATGDNLCLRTFESEENVIRMDHSSFRQEVDAVCAPSFICTSLAVDCNSLKRDELVSVESMNVVRHVNEPEYSLNVNELLVSSASAVSMNPCNLVSPDQPSYGISCDRTQDEKDHCREQAPPMHQCKVSGENADTYKSVPMSDGESLRQELQSDSDEQRKWFSGKKKVALLIGYSGLDFCGMQKNPNVDTIEERLVTALASIKAIREEHKEAFLNAVENMMQYSSASRTDKGVSAAWQVVSLKVVAGQDFLMNLNAALPATIRVFGMERVTKGFNAKRACSGRDYEYLTPSFAFASTKTEYDSNFRLSVEEVASANGVLQHFLGTHNFHNFTSGKLFEEKSANRYITEFMLGHPFTWNDHEFVSVHVSGQSFMIHQIRKMIGLCIAICRGYCSSEVLEKCWGPKKVDIPRAPGLGLLLKKVHFRGYDKKFGKDGLHNQLTFAECQAQADHFKVSMIWPAILEEEITKQPMVQWLKTLAVHSYAECNAGALGEPTETKSS